MIKVMLWKEAREGVMVWLTVGLIGALMMAVAPIIFEMLDFGTYTSRRHSLVMILAVLGITYGLIAGSLSLAGERENRTMDFLDGLTGQRAPIWWTKFLTACIYSLALGIVFTLAYEWIPRIPFFGDTFEHRSIRWTLLPFLALEAYLFGMLGSALCPTVMSAISLSVIIYLLSWYIGGGLTVATSSELYIVIRFVITTMVATIAGLTFNRRIEVTSAPPPIRKKSDKQLTTVSPLRTLFWLIRRQHGWLLFSLLGLSFFSGFGFGNLLPMFWPMITLLIGITCGTCVWSQEQTRKEARFLGDQRMPLRYTWAFRTGFWLLTGILSIALFTWGSILHFYMETGDFERAINTLTSRIVFFKDYMLWLDDPWIYYLIWFSHGFALSQLLAITCQRTIVTVVVAIPASLALIAPWLPSFLIGGLPLWRTLIGPLLLLLISYNLYWWWITERITATKPLIIAFSSPLILFGWIGINLWYRAIELPDPGTPFDIAKVEQELDETTESPAGPAIVQALHGFHARRERQKDLRQQIAPLLREYFDNQEWNQPSKKIAEYLDQVVDKELIAEFYQAVRHPLGLIVDPRMTVTIPLVLRNDLRDLMILINLRIKQQLSKGQYRECLQLFETMFGLLRHWRNYSDTMNGGVLALQMESILYLTMKTWIRSIQSQSELLSSTLALLKNHISKTPPLERNVQAEYFSSWNRLKDELWSDSVTFRDGEADKQKEIIGDLYELSFLLPWERKRGQRMINILFHPATKIEPASLQSWHIYYYSLRLYTLKELQSLANRFSLDRKFRMLEVALLLYQHDHQSSAKSLDDLVPEYLSEIPQDPYGNGPLNYRVSQGETIDIPIRQSAEPGDSEKIVFKKRTIKPGQGLLWSERLRDSHEDSDFISIVPLISK